MILDSLSPSQEYDLLVIGAGPAGLVCAYEFAKRAPEKKVLIIESGGVTPAHGHAQSLALSQVQGDLPAAHFAFHGARNLGGNTHVWDGFCATLENRGFESGEWPISYQELAQYYPAAAEWLELPEQSHQAAEVPFGKGSDFVYKPYFLSTPKRFNDAQTHSWLKESDSVDVLFSKTVASLHSESGRVSEIELIDTQTKEKNRIKVSGKLVLALGGIQNARVLQLSLANRKWGSLGQGLAEHPHVYRKMDLWLNPDKTPEALRQKNARIWHGIALSSDVARNSKTVSATFDVVDPQLVEVNFLGQRRQMLKCNTTVRAEMSLLASNRVTLAEQKDALDQPQAAVEFTFPRAELNEAVALFSNQLLRHQLGRLSVLPPNYEIKGGGHMMGTTRMGQNANDSVVNADCKLHRFDNVYLAGSSVFPSVAAANPTFSIVALSIRLAKHLSEVTKGAT